MADDLRVLKFSIDKLSDEIKALHKSYRKVNNIGEYAENHEEIEND